MGSPSHLCLICRSTYQFHCPLWPIYTGPACQLLPKNSVLPSPMKWTCEFLSINHTRERPLLAVWDPPQNERQILCPLRESKALFPLARTLLNCRLSTRKECWRENGISGGKGRPYGIDSRATVLVAFVCWIDRPLVTELCSGMWIPSPPPANSLFLQMVPSLPLVHCKQRVNPARGIKGCAPSSYTKAVLQEDLALILLLRIGLPHQ